MRGEAWRSGQMLSTEALCREGDSCRGVRAEPEQQQPNVAMVVLQTFPSTLCAELVPLTRTSRLHTMAPKALLAKK